MCVSWIVSLLVATSGSLTAIRISNDVRVVHKLAEDSVYSQHTSCLLPAKANGPTNLLIERHMAAWERHGRWWRGGQGKLPSHQPLRHASDKDWRK